MYGENKHDIHLHPTNLVAATARWSSEVRRQPRFRHNLEYEVFCNENPFDIRRNTSRFNRRVREQRPELAERISASYW